MPGPQIKLHRTAELQQCVCVSFSYLRGICWCLFGKTEEAGCIIGMDQPRSVAGQQLFFRGVPILGNKPVNE
jgi:hypothetical protein